jgi:hypothetical protein
LSLFERGEQVECRSAEHFTSCNPLPLARDDATPGYDVSFS